MIVEVAARATAALLAAEHGRHGRLSRRPSGRWVLHVGKVTVVFGRKVAVRVAGGWRREVVIDWERFSVEEAAAEVIAMLR